MAWPTDAEHRDLIARFHEATVPASLRLNTAHGTPNTDTRGYHETVTGAYLVLLARFACTSADLAGAELARALLESPLAHREVLFTYYSRGRLMSVAARRDWVEPDLLPLPEDVV